MEILDQITPNQAWEAAVAQLKGSLNKQTFSILVGKSAFSRYDDQTFYISIPNTFTRDWVEQRLTEPLERLTSGIMNSPQNVRFVLAQAPEPTAQDQQMKVETAGFGQKIYQRSNTINPRYTFENFIVGASNNLAHAACRAVAAMPSTAYNPLFIYSGVGLGKTHLAHAIGNEILKHGDKSVLYVSSEEFTNDYIYSLQHHESFDFREKYRNADVLLIDDIQFIIGKESTQEEFYHTFNMLYQQDKQIVITSDRAPKAMSTLDERMRSRFEWGLTIDIQAPDLETRMAILASKAEKCGKTIPNDVQEMIARRVQTNIREMEGALTRIFAICDLCGRTLNRDLVSMALGEALEISSKKSKSEIIDAAAKMLGVETARLLSRDRTQAVALARQVVMYILRQGECLSYPQIGVELGGRNHSTVVHACEKVEKMLQADNRFRSQYQQIYAELYGEGQLIPA